MLTLANSYNIPLGMTNTLFDNRTFGYRVLNNCVGALDCGQPCSAALQTYMIVQRKIGSVQRVKLIMGLICVQLGDGLSSGHNSGA